MKYIIYNNYKYKVIDKFDYNETNGMYEYQILVTDRTIKRNKFLYCPMYINGKFRWLTRADIRFRLTFTRKKDFDDGWSYRVFYTQWKPEWEIIEIL